jgi:hypothetical protein
MRRLRLMVLVLILASAAGCSQIRDYEPTPSGPLLSTQNRGWSLYPRQSLPPIYN